MEKSKLIEEGERILGCVKQVPGFGLFGNTKFPENALDEDNYRALFIWQKQVCAYLSENGLKTISVEANRINCFCNTVKNGVDRNAILQLIDLLKV